MKHFYFHIHVPKNAGTTFDTILRRIFRERFLRYDDVRPGYIFNDTEKQRVIASNKRKRCFSGHALRYPVFLSPGTKIDYFTFLRHPIDRIVSLYAYEQRKLPESRQFNLNFEDWVRKRVEIGNALSNYQAFHITGVYEPDLVCLENAKAVLDKFTFVGVSEMFDESLLVLKQKINLGFYQLVYAKKNVTNSKRTIAVSNETRDLLFSKNRIDILLYEYALSRLERELKSLGSNLTYDLVKLKRLNKIYSKYNVAGKLHPLKFTINHLVKSRTLPRRT